MSGVAQPRGPASSGDGAEARDLIERLFVLMRTVSTHGEAHPACRAAAEAVSRAASTLELPASIQFVAGAVFQDRTLVPMDPEGFERAGILAGAVHNLGVHELTFQAPPALESLLQVGRALAAAAHSPSGGLQGLALPDITWREIPGATSGQQGVRVAPDVLAATHVALAVDEAAGLVAPDQPWEWRGGVSVVRRVEQALEEDRLTALRVLELAEGDWSLSRRAVLACLQVLLGLSGLGVSMTSRRAAGHATLALCASGLRPREGATVQEAVTPTLKRLLDAAVASKTGVEPHRLRVCSVVYELGRRQPDPSQRNGILGMIQLAYDLARRRCPVGVEFDLTLADLNAYAASAAGERFHPEWVKALIASTHDTPPGSYVRLADGTIGLALERGPEGDPLRPRVLADGEVYVPEQPVSLVSVAEICASWG